MKKSILVILSCVLSLVLVLGSCKSNTENESKEAETEKTEQAEKSECVKEITTMDEAVAAMEKVCKAGEKDAVLKCAVQVNEFMAKTMIDALNSVKTAEDFEKISNDIDGLADRLDKVMEDCDCVTEEELNEAVESVNDKHEEEMTTAMTEAMTRIGIE